MEVTPWEVMATLFGLATTVAGVAAKIVFDRLKDMQRAIKEQQDFMTEVIGKIYQRIEGDRLESHKTFATKDGVEKALDRVLVQIDRMATEVKGEIAKLRDQQKSDRRDDGAGTR